VAFDFSFNLDNSLVYIRASAGIDFASSVEAMETLLSDQRFSRQTKMLVDIRDVDSVISVPEVLRLLASSVWHSVIDSHRLAIVAGKPVQFGMANVLARRTGDIAEIQPFYSLEEALSWLGDGEEPFSG
jgi:hypothetical protein